MNRSDSADVVLALIVQITANDYRFSLEKTLYGRFDATGIAGMRLVIIGVDDDSDDSDDDDE